MTTEVTEARRNPGNRVCSGPQLGDVPGVNPRSIRLRHDPMREERPRRIRTLHVFSVPSVVNSFEARHRHSSCTHPQSRCLSLSPALQGRGSRIIWSPRLSNSIGERRHRSCGVPAFEFRISCFEFLPLGTCPLSLVPCPLSLSHTSRHNRPTTRCRPAQTERGRFFGSDRNSRLLQSL